MASDGAPPKTGGADDGAPPQKKSEPAPFRWKDLPSEGACMPVLGVAELWPELGSAAASAKGKGKATASSAAPVAAPKTTTAALPEQIPQGATSKQNANGRGQASVNVNGNAYRNRGAGGCHGHEHRGGFNGQPRGRGHHGPEHRPPLGPPMGYVEAPHHMHPPPLPPQQFMGMAPPPMPYSYYYGLPYGYQEFVPGYFAPPLQEALPQFMPEAQQPFLQYYTGPQVHMMHANFELQPQHAQWQQASPNQEQQLTPEELQQEIRQQIEYYFSARNLEGDTFLRENMDEQGWVPLTVVASFWRILNKTRDIEFILNSVLQSTEVEVQDGKIRKRVGWEEYPPVPPSN